MVKNQPHMCPKNNSNVEICLHRMLKLVLCIIFFGILLQHSEQVETWIGCNDLDRKKNEFVETGQHDWHGNLKLLEFKFKLSTLFKMIFTPDSVLFLFFLKNFLL